MKSFFNKNPTLAMAAFAVIICSLRFLFDGVEIVIAGHSFTVPHTDATAYAAFLTPVLSVHGYLRGKSKNKGLNKQNDNTRKKVDDPDGN